MYGVVRDASLAILPTFDLVTEFPIYNTYIFGNDLVVTSSTLLHFELLKTFILSSS